MWYLFSSHSDEKKEAFSFLWFFSANWKEALTELFRFKSALRAINRLPPKLPLPLGFQTWFASRLNVGFPKRSPRKLLTPTRPIRSVEIRVYFPSNDSSRRIINFYQSNPPAPVRLPTHSHEVRRTLSERSLQAFFFDRENNVCCPFYIARSTLVDSFPHALSVVRGKLRWTHLQYMLRENLYLLHFWTFQTGHNQLPLSYSSAPAKLPTHSHAVRRTPPRALPESFIFARGILSVS